MLEISSDLYCITKIITILFSTLKTPKMSPIFVIHPSMQQRGYPHLECSYEPIQINTNAVPTPYLHRFIFGFRYEIRR